MLLIKAILYVEYTSDPIVGLVLLIAYLILSFSFFGFSYLSVWFKKSKNVRLRNIKVFVSTGISLYLTCKSLIFLFEKDLTLYENMSKIILDFSKSLFTI